MTEYYFCASVKDAIEEYKAAGFVELTFEQLVERQELRPGRRTLVHADATKVHFTLFAPCDDAL